MRESRGLRQKDLSASAKITPATLSRIESGKIKKIRPETLLGLSQALGVSAEYLSGRTSQVNPGSFFEADDCFVEIFASYTKLGKEGRETLRNIAKFLETDEGLKASSLLSR